MNKEKEHGKIQTFFNCLSTILFVPDGIYIYIISQITDEPATLVDLWEALEEMWEES